MQKVSKSLLIKLCSFTLLYSVVLLFSACGKQETAGGVVGGASGAIIGAAVSGKNNRGTGALIGGLIGSFVGKEAGRSGDDEEAEDERRYERIQTQRKLNQLDNENKQMRENMKKWCFSCGRQTNLIGAHRCPDCGGDLIREKFCRSCTSVFSPNSSYRYCPYCKDRVALSGR